MLGRRTGADRAARDSYRKSLPLWLRMRRAVGVLGVLALGLLFFRVVGRDPIAWVRHQVYALRGTLVVASGVEAKTEPASAALAGSSADNAVDGKSDTAWTTDFSGVTSATGPPCARNAGEAALLLTAPKQITVRAINIRAGVPDQNIDLKLWRPKTLDLQFSDGTCRQVALQDSSTAQLIRLRTVRTNTVRIMVADAYAPEGQSPSTQLAISDVGLMIRPN